MPLGTSLEVWRLRRHATSARLPAELSVFSSVEFCLWDAQDDATNFQRNFNIGEVEVEGSVIYHKTEYRERRNHFAYFACSQPLAGFDTQTGGVPRPLPGLGPPDGGGEGGVGQLRGPRLGSPRIAPRPLWPWARARRQEVIFVLGYAENATDDKFDPAGQPGAQQAARVSR